MRKVRERLGGGNPATIGRAINALETELAAAGVERIALPELPPDIAELMQRLWRAAVGAQLDDVARLRGEAQGVADSARTLLNEAQLRAEVLKAEVTELRAELAARDMRLAQAATDLAARTERTAALQHELEAMRERTGQLDTELGAVRQAQAQAVAAAQERYEGLSRRLLEETAQQRQAVQGEVVRLTSQLKFADKRQQTLEGRIQQLEAELAEARGQVQQAAGETSALRYVNTSLRAQLDEIVRALPGAKAPPPAPGRAKRTPNAKAAKSVKPAP